MMARSNDHTVIEMSEREPMVPERIIPEIHISNNSSLQPTGSVFRPINERLSPTGGHSNHNNNTNVHNDPIVPRFRNRRSISDHDEQMKPLLEVVGDKPKPPLAGPEIDDIDDDEGTPATADNHPGIDDGFFHSTDEVQDPSIGNRFGEKDDDHPTPGSEPNPEATDDPDGPANGINTLHYGGLPNGRGTPRFRPESPFPYAPEFRPDLQPPIITPDVNVYQQKKTLAQGMMDLALLSANANQLRYVLEASNLHPYYYPSLIFISASLILQICVGIGLILNSRYNVKEHEDICKADRINDLTVIGIFLITIVNVFIASFGVAQSQNVTTDPVTQPK